MNPTPEEGGSPPPEAALPTADGQAAAEALPTEPQQTAEEASDRRASPRRKKLLRILVTNAMSTEEPFPGWIVDRSIGGLCLSVDHEIEQGTILRVRRPNAPANVPWVDIRVQSIRRQDDTFDLGCEFLRTPTWEILIQFG